MSLIETADPVGQVLSVGDVVRISDFAAEFEIGGSYDVSGMKGVVTELFSEDENQVRVTHAMIRWTADTIRAIPEAYVSQCVENEYCWTMTNVPADRLEITGEPFDEIEWQWTVNEKASEFFWGASPEGRKLRQLFYAADRKKAMIPAQVVLDFLHDQVRLPAGAIVSYESPDPEDVKLDTGTRVELVAFNSADIRMNLYCEVVESGRSYLLPLEDLESTEKRSSKNSRLFEIYYLWVSSRL